MRQRQRKRETDRETHTHRERERERERERGRDTGRGRSRLHVGSPMWVWIPGPLGSGPEPKADLPPLSHPRRPRSRLFEKGLQAWSGRTEIGRSGFYYYTGVQLRFGSSLC